MSHPIPLYSKRNVLLAIRQEAAYTGDRQELRRKIIERAKEIDATYLIPANWNEDGTVK